MRVLITSSVDLRKTAPNRLHHFVRYLSRKHEITAICINDWWKAGLVDTSKYYQDFKEILDNIDIKYITEKKITPFKQELLSPRLIKLESCKDFDVLLNSDAPISGYYIAKKLNLPMIYDLADDVPEMIANSPQIPRLLRPFGKWIGRYMLKRNIAIAKKVMGISRTLQNKYLIPDEKFELIPNGVDTKLFRKVESDLRERLGLEDNFVLGYVGVLREWVDLTPVYQAIKNLEDVKLLIVGEEGMLKENREIVRRYRVEDKVVFAGTVPYTKVPEYISAMDVCLIPFKRNAISQNAVPLKLFEYMACEKPVISTRLEGVMEVVGDMILYADTVDEYIAQIKNIIDNTDLAEELGEKGRKFVIENYDWKKIVGRLDLILEDIQYSEKVKSTRES